MGLSERVLRVTVYRGRELDTMEVTFLGLIGLSSLFQVIGNTAPNSISMLLPHTFRVVWLVILFLGSVVGLAGIFWPKQIVDAILLEIVGLTWVFFAIIIYGSAQIVAVVANGSALGSVMSGSITILLGLSFGLKALRLQGVIERLKKE